MSKRRRVAVATLVDIAAASATTLWLPAWMLLPTLIVVVVVFAPWIVEGKFLWQR